MSYQLNPFIPYQPVDPNQFIGREKEIRELELALLHAKQEQQRHFLITGDRGIGKTSFLDYIRGTARSYSEELGATFNFIVVDVVIDKSTTRLDLIKKIRRALNYELAKNEPAKEFLTKAWGFISRVEAAGISLKQLTEKDKNDNLLYDELGDSLIDIVGRSCMDGDPDSIITGKAYDGILILLDEADQASPSLGLGSFIKYLLELLRRHSCKKVLFGVAGLPNVVDVLLKSHRSSLRIFDELKLPCLSLSEVSTLLDELVIGAQAGGHLGFMITDQAKNIIWEYSDGHPQFCHQIGYNAFEAASKELGIDDDVIIDASHVVSGAFGERGALDIIGDVYFRDVYEDLKNSHHELNILRLLTETEGFAVDLDGILSSMEVDADMLDYAIENLVDSGLILFNSRNHNCKLKYASFAYWFSSNNPGLILKETKN